MSASPANLIWIDLEMTGLVPEQHRIIEIATLVTNSQLELLAEGPVLAVYQPDDELAKMDEWNVRQHGQSGLVQRVRTSSVGEMQAERATIEFLEQWVPAGKSPMCGNSICQDRRFLARWMPALEKHFHYRNLDVSTLKELCQRWAPDVARGLTKESRHLALDDIRDSVAELRYYRQHFLKLAG
ncbi:MAG TPA: oligoribonuclease [Candidatus Binatia bacterium]|nr:oligoribonuclease [Candidatus Binatia bacterium]